MHTEKINTQRPARKHQWLKYAFPLAGLAALIWFLVRVIPRPSRARYPCQRAAFPLASAFIVWLAGLAASALSFAKARLSSRQRRFVVAVICVVLSIGSLSVAVNTAREKPGQAEPQAVNEPIGVARGIDPGRVVWVHDPDATSWRPGFGHPWQADNTDYKRVQKMMARAICELTGETADAGAWDKLFRYLNKARGKGDVGYKPGEKIVVKVNFVGFIATHSWGGSLDYMNTSPQLILALLQQLTEKAGVKQENISVGDSLADLDREYYRLFEKRFPDVRYVAYSSGYKQNIFEMKESSVPLYWSSKPKKCEQDYVPKCFAEADYLINFANLKIHAYAGVTLCAKNHYGSLIRTPVEDDYYDLHTSAFDKEAGRYRALVDLMGHSHIGGKTVLYLIDGLYCGIHPEDDRPQKWDSYPFNEDWTSSLLASQDPVAIDSVGYDFLYAEYEDYLRGDAGADDYLHEAALADKPPSGVFYDPDHPGDVKRSASLGVHEHWNNSRDKKYSRNLGTGNGIELVAVKIARDEETRIIAPGAKVKELADEFDFTEGPAVDSEGNIFFTDQPNNRIHKWSTDNKLSTFHESPGRANGLYFGRDGKLLACADMNNELWAIDMKGKVTVLVKDYEGKKINGPNDLWVDPKGGIYFSDPFYRRPYWERGPMEQDGQHVYYLAPDRKKVLRAADDLFKPNGIIGTPDGKLLYVADIGGDRTYVYNIGADGTLSGKKLFCGMGSDGMTIDNEGNIYLTGEGVTVFNPAGKKIEQIPIDAKWTANVCFGGKDGHTLFITATTSLYSLRMRVKGVQVQ